MTNPVDQLLSLVEHKNIKRNELIDALYVLRAPWSLSGIVPTIDRFFVLIGHFPELGKYAHCPDYDRRLECLRIVQEFALDNPAFAGATLGKDVPTQLRPFCGDSAVADLLLIQHRSSEEHTNEKFDRLIAWFVWQAIRFNFTTLPLAGYARYLTSNGSVRLTPGLGSQLYAAELSIRNLGDLGEQAKLSGIHGLDLSLSDDRSLRFTLLLRFAALKDGATRRRLAAYAKRTYGYTDETLTQHAEEVANHFPDNVPRFLKSIWLTHLEAKMTGGRSRRRYGSSRDVFKPQLRRYRLVTEVVTPIDNDAIQGGVIVDYCPTIDRQTDFDEDDDPDTNEIIEPSFSLFLGESGDLLRSFYAAKGMQTAIEYGNAMLPWARWRLSEAATAEVASLVHHDGAEGTAERLGRLAIGLSLICGRPLAEFSMPVFALGVPKLSKAHPVGISLDEMSIYVIAAVPSLKSKAKLLEHCALACEHLRLPLPERWRFLVERCAKETAKKVTPIVRAARRLLSSLPANLGFSERGLRGRLAAELLQLTKGDLGVVKVITDADDANLANIIHYASYPTDTIEYLWRKAAITLVGPLPQLALGKPGTRVGSPHSFDLDRVAKHFAEHRDRFHARLAEQKWVSVFNSMTVYTAHWLSLASTGRKTKRPTPVLTIIGPWGLIADKHLMDGSTDRLLPFTQGLQRQLAAYKALASHLALQHPGLEPFEQTERGFRLRLQYIDKDGIVTPYQPKVQEQSSQWKPLPGNWARKLVRAEAGDLHGRMVDAGSGHAVRGRHPWRQTSTFAVPAFRSDWLKLQEALEQRLGFEPLVVPEIESTRRAYSPLLPQTGSLGSPPPSQGHQSEVGGDTDPELMARLQTADRYLFEEVFNEVDPDPSCGLELVRRLLVRENRLSESHRLRLAESSCELIRRKARIPLFAMKPRPQFSKDWMVDAEALQSLAWYETEVIPRFRTELQRLPVPGTTDLAHLVEVGRLLMIGVWRLGLTRLAVLEPFLQCIASDRPILATGTLRYFSIRVRCHRTGEPMMRTVMLDDLSAAYLAVERARLRLALVAFFKMSRARRHAAFTRALHRYLDSIGAPTKAVRLPALMRAAVQRLMLEGSPILAAYSSGDFYTQDLDDRELRRLAGLNPSRVSVGSDTKALPQHDGYSETDVELGEGADRLDLNLPKDVRQSAFNFAHVLVSHRSPYWSQLKADVGNDKPSPSSLVEGLLKAFALWLLEQEVPHLDKAKLKTRRRKNWINRITIVGHALLGMALPVASSLILDEATLERLVESCAEHFPERATRGAWYKFKAYLRDECADHAGIEVGHLGNNTDHAVSAKMLRADEISAIAERLRSARSGIGNPDFRVSAARLFDLVSTIGARRGEVEKLRPEDVQGDLLRIQPYDDHTLKTAWSERVVPLAFLPERAKTWIANAEKQGLTRLIDPRPGVTADGSNFFDAVNKVIKEITGDENLGLHHLRHTVAGRLLLSVLAPAADLGGITNDLPWVQSLLVPPETLDVLIGHEGPSGHGLQAISALLGHSHPTTTLAHYIHILCVAFYALIEKLDPIDITSTFENRIASLKTVERWATEARATLLASEVEAAREAALRRLMRNKMEQAVKKLHGRDISSFIDIDEQSVIRGNIAPLESHVVTAANDPESLVFDRIEAIDRALRGEPLANEDPWLDSARQGLARIATTPSGKKGAVSKSGEIIVFRHPMQCGPAGLPLPIDLPAQTATKAAVNLIEWLEQLRIAQRDDFDWLLSKWLNASESERGRMRLDSDVEVMRASKLPNNRQIRVAIEVALLSARDKAAFRKPVTRMRICVLGDGQFDRDIKAVRWVMTWVVAICMQH